MLTVAQLIETLRRFDPDLPVTRWVDPCPGDIGSVALVDQAITSGYVKDGRFVKAVALLSADQFTEDCTASLAGSGKTGHD